MSFNICKFFVDPSHPCIGLALEGGRIADLRPAGISSLEQLLEAENPVGAVRQAFSPNLPTYSGEEVSFFAPVDRQEIWAAGVTYERSKTARMEESSFSATAYDRVYEAERPELFFKALAEKAVGHGETVGIRRDARWSVPEPELAVVLSSKGKIAGYTIGNDMSSRDIEGENLLYLPQAKIYERSCALGPWIRLGASETDAREWSISVEILREGKAAFAGSTPVGRIKRSLAELADFLFRSQKFPHGAVLLTGTGVVPPDGFTLAEGDVVRIEISGIGHLENTVAVV